LISHDAVVEASLRIIDREGLDAFSLPRLARELNVQTPSLYYHFRDRADILRTVARAIVLQSRVPAPDACRTWVDWFVGISLSFRRAVLSHRNAAPILLEFMPRDVLIWNYELGVQILAAVGVPVEARIGVIDGLDTLTLGASLAEAARSPARAGQVFANVDADAEPMLADALAANTRTAEQLFADSIRSFLRGAVPGVPPDVPAPRTLIARYRDTRAAAASHDGLDGSGLPVVAADALKPGFHGVRTPWDPGFHGVPGGPDRAQIGLSRRAGSRRRRRRTHGVVRVATCCPAGWLRQSSAAGLSWPGRRWSPDRRTSPCRLRPSPSESRARRGFRHARQGCRPAASWYTRHP
jgi:AcrR family transcriptional regulator